MRGDKQKIVVLLCEGKVDGVYHNFSPSTEVEVIDYTNLDSKDVIKLASVLGRQYSTFTEPISESKEGVKK